MARRLPPLNGLRAIEAAGRRLSIRQAADELCVTPAAVSQQVRLIEDLAGKRVFHRTAQGLELTEAGARALPLLSDAFDQLARAAEILESDRATPRLAVSAPSSFAARWLLPRLAEFRAFAGEDLRARIDGDDALVDFTRNEADLAIRFGGGAYDGLTAELLFPAVFIPICRPALLERLGPIDDAADLARLPLIHRAGGDMGPFSPSWSRWLAMAGATGIDAEAGHRFGSAALTIDAALAGHGVALAAEPLVRQAIEDGDLAAPLKALSRETADVGYYLVYPDQGALSRGARLFRAWILTATRGAAAAAESD